MACLLILSYPGIQRLLFLPCCAKRGNQGIFLLNSDCLPIYPFQNFKQLKQNLGLDYTLGVVIHLELDYIMEL